MNEFGKRLITLRKNCGLTQAQLAKQLSLSPSAIGNYEVGGRIPRAEQLLSICNYFNVSVDYMLGGETLPDEIGELMIKLKGYYTQGGKLKCRGIVLNNNQTEKLFDFLLMSADVIIANERRAVTENEPAPIRPE